VARAEIDYRRPIHLGEEVRVGARVVRVGRTSFAMDYRVEAAGELAAEARTVHVWLGEDGRPRSLPGALRARVAELELRPVEGL